MESSASGEDYTIAYKIVNKTGDGQEIVAYGEIDTSDDKQAITLETSTLEIGNYDVYTWLQKNNAKTSNEAGVVTKSTLTVSETMTYTLSFETNNGSSIESITRLEGTEIDLSEYVPEKAGFTFDGWYSDEALTEPVTAITLTADITIYAKWIEGIEATEIKIDSSSLVILRKKDTLQLNVNVIPANASPNITSTSSNSDVASIDENGLVTANKVGTVQIKASTDNGLESTVVIRISA